MHTAIDLLATRALALNASEPPGSDIAYAPVVSTEPGGQL